MRERECVCERENTKVDKTKKSYEKGPLCAPLPSIPLSPPPSVPRSPLCLSLVRLMPLFLLCPSTLRAPLLCAPLPSGLSGLKGLRSNIHSLKFYN
jgi:hypothetical protein